MGSPCNDDHSRGNTGRKYTAWESNIIQASLRKQNANPSSGLSTVYDSDYLVCQPVGPFHLQLTSWCFSSSFNIVPVTIIKLLLILSFYITVNKLWASLVAQRVKNLPACQRPGGRPQVWSSWVRKIPWRREWQPTVVFLPRESPGQRSLVGTVHGVAKSWTCLSD